MKKTIFVIAAVALAAVSCEKKGGENTGKPLDATFTFALQSAELVYAEPTDISGTFESTVAIEKAVLTAVKKQTDDTYSAVGEPQDGVISGTKVTARFFADAKDLDAVELKLYADKKEKAFYLPASVTGEEKGTVWMNDAVGLRAAPMIPNHDNDPDNYPVEGTGAGCDMMSFFSMRGVMLNGEARHILSLDDVRKVEGDKVSMEWVNVLQNTSNKAYIGSQRGFAFVRCNSLTAGTVGRQCDVYAVDGKKLDVSKTDNVFGLSVIRGSWAGERYDETEYKFVDKIFIDIKTAGTKLEKIKAYWQLSQIQKVLDNATLGVEENPTNLSNKNMYRRYVEAGETSAKALIEEFRAGDYFIIRSFVGTAEEQRPIYGIIQVLQLPDDSGTFTLESLNVPGKMCMDKEKTAELFGTTAYFSIKTQCEI